MCTLLIEIQLTVSSVKRNKGPKGAEIFCQLYKRQRERERYTQTKTQQEKRLGGIFDDWKKTKKSYMR